MLFSFQKLFFLLTMLYSYALVLSCSNERCFPISRPLVYSIVEHNDSIYFSTRDSGIFRFSPDNPEYMLQVGGRCRFPIRTIAFLEEGSLVAASYRTGVHYVNNDSLVPLVFAQRPAWSMKFDEQGGMWLAGLHGIFRQHKDSLVLFSKMGGVHDLAFSGKTLAVAHMNGISLFNTENGSKEADYCRGVVCWSISRYDSLFIGGGLNLCAIIGKGKEVKIPFGPKNNMLWATARTSGGKLYLATQNGLYSVQGTNVRRAGFNGKCVKSLLIDSHGRLWVGRFD